MPNKPTPERDIRNPAKDEIEDLGTNSAEDEDVDKDDEEFEDDDVEDDEDVEDTDAG